MGECPPAPNEKLSAAPLAGVWSVEDVGERQLPGNARAADLWNEGSVRVSQPPGGCGLPGRQQAGAFCRVNRARPTNRASGVSCTAGAVALVKKRSRQQDILLNQCLEWHLKALTYNVSPLKRSF